MLLFTIILGVIPTDRRTELDATMVMESISLLVFWGLQYKFIQVDIFTNTYGIMSFYL